MRTAINSRAALMLAVTAVAVSGRPVTEARADQAADDATRAYEAVERIAPADYLELREMMGDNLAWLQYDSDYDNYVTRREFLAGYARGVARLRPTDAAALKLFEQLEQHVDGRLSRGVEFQDPARALYQKYDLDGNGDVSVAEFLEGYAEEHAPTSRTAPPSPSRPASAPDQQSRPAAAPQRAGAGQQPASHGSGAIKVGDIVEIAETAPVDGKWDEYNVSAGRIIAIQDQEPRYRVRLYTAGGAQRDLFQYSHRVRAAQGAVYDDYDPRRFFGTWNVGMGATRTETVSGERETSSGTLRTGRSEVVAIGDDNRLTISSDGSFAWRSAGGQTVRGRWVRSDDPDFPITLKQAHQGVDWGVGPFGLENGVYNIRVKRSGSAPIQMHGPPVGQLAEVSPVYVGPRGPLARSWKVGDKVEVNSGGAWYPATIRQVVANGYLIRYDDFSSSHDAVVNVRQIRPRR